ncbi:unnamed protein product, partial [Tetraodon nigroviridis]
EPECLCSSSIGQRYPRRRSLWCFLLCLLFSVSSAGLMVSPPSQRLSAPPLERMEEPELPPQEKSAWSRLMVCVLVCVLWKVCVL